MRVENELHDDIYGAIVRSRRIVETMEQLLGGEVYHYHHKMILKEPFTGGAWEWHQDYGYWYNNGCLYPLLASCMIAVDRATAENGCLQVLKGSHHLGRIDHGKVGDQTGADPERVDGGARAAGDGALRSSSPARRSSSTATCCTAPTRTPATTRAGRSSAATTPPATIPTRNRGIPRYTPLEKLPDEAVKEYGRRQIRSIGSQSEVVT